LLPPTPTPGCGGALELKRVTAVIISILVRGGSGLIILVPAKL